MSQVISIKKKTLWPLFMDGVQLYSHFEEAVHFLPFSSQKFLVLIGAINITFQFENSFLQVKLIYHYLSQCALGYQPPSKIPTLFLAISPPKSANCPSLLFRRFPLYIVFCVKPPKILKFFILHPILLFKSNLIFS